jgi:hypothetical protein
VCFHKLCAWRPKRARVAGWHRFRTGKSMYVRVRCQVTYESLTRAACVSPPERALLLPGGWRSFRPGKRLRRLFKTLVRRIESKVSGSSGMPLAPGQLRSFWPGRSYTGSGKPIRGKLSQYSNSSTERCPRYIPRGSSHMHHQSINQLID